MVHFQYRHLHNTSSHDDFHNYMINELHCLKQIIIIIIINAFQMSRNALWLYVCEAQSVIHETVQQYTTWFNNALHISLCHSSSPATTTRAHTHPHTRTHIQTRNPSLPPLCPSLSPPPPHPTPKKNTFTSSGHLNDDYDYNSLGSVMKRGGNKRWLWL